MYQNIYQPDNYFYYYSQIFDRQGIFAISKGFCDNYH